MLNHGQGFRFAVKAFPADNVRSSQLDRAMVPHPLIYQELPHNPEYFVYNHRLASGSMNNATADEVYWMVRRTAVLRHTGELPLEIRGPDAEKMLDRVFTRNISTVKVGRCSYQFACYDDGGMITDGVLMRFSQDRFWFGQADGDLFSWLKAHARGLDVEVSDPNVWISQVQGPCSLEILKAAVDGDYPEPFRYFDIAQVQIAGQRVIVSRTGFTNELGWEFYLEPNVDVYAVGDRILEAGKPYGMMPTAAVAFRTRRIEAGLLSAGADFDESVTPFAAGLGDFVDLGKADFTGKAALEAADKRRSTWGMRVRGGVAQIGNALTKNAAPAGVVCSSAWSPYQRCGVTIVRLNDPDLGPGTMLEVECSDGQTRPAETCDTPMYDKKREIPRGKLIDIPQMPDTVVA